MVPVLRDLARDHRRADVVVYDVDWLGETPRTDCIVCLDLNDLQAISAVGLGLIERSIGGLYELFDGALAKGIGCGHADADSNRNFGLQSTNGRLVHGQAQALREL